MKRRLCSNDKHIWRPGRGAEVCVNCGTRFPCARPGCGHIDCHEARGEGPPVKQEHELLTAAEVEAIWQIKVGTLASMRCRGGGPPFARLGSGRLIRYRRADIEAWIASRVVSVASAPDTSPGMPGIEVAS